MPGTLVHGFDEVWVSSAPDQFVCEVDTFAVSGRSMRIATTGAEGALAAYTPATPIDLDERDELRFWLSGGQIADGSPNHPFLLELGYDDAGDLPGEQHSWLIPVGRAGVWEQHRIGLAGHRRSSITRWWLRSRTDRPVRVNIDELLAVHEDPVSDVESELARRLAVDLPGMTDIALQPAAAGATTLVIARNPRFRKGNKVVIGAHQYDVTDAAHDATKTTLTIAPPLIAAGGVLSAVLPVVVEESPLVPPSTPDNLPDPVVVLALSDQRDELDRGWGIEQRDSFRVSGELTVCSVRPAPVPILLEYQILVAATDRAQSLAIRSALLLELADLGLRVNGTVLPLRMVPPPALFNRNRAVVAPVYVHISARVEAGSRREVPWVRRAEAKSAHLSDPQDQEGIVLSL